MKKGTKYNYNGRIYISDNCWDTRFYKEESPHGHIHLISVMYYMFEAFIDKDTLSFILVRENELENVSVPLSCQKQWEEDIVWKKVWNEVSPRVIDLGNCTFYHGHWVKKFQIK